MFTDKRYIILTFCVLIAAGFLYTYADAPLAWYFHYNTPTWLHSMAEYATKVGDSVWFLVPSLVLWVGLWWVRRDFARSAMFMFLSVAGSGLFGIILKVLFSRARPPLLFDHGIYGFFPFAMATDFLHNSFPSGHSATAMSAATVLALLFPPLRFLFYPLGILICCTRVVVGVHYASDILVGALFGWLAADILYKRLFRNTVNTKL